MELVKQTQSWISDIQHCVSYDSWSQFIIMEDGLNTNWGHLSMLTWGCRPEKRNYLFQLVYIDLYDKRNNPEILPAFRKHRFELKCVEITVKESDVPSIRQWLVSKNPDLWKMNFLTEKPKATE